MAKQTSLYLHTGINASGQQFTSGDTTTAKDLFTAGSNDSDLKVMSITSSDTASVNMQLFYFDGSTSYLIATVRAVTLTGTDGAANAVDLLNSVASPFIAFDDSGKRFIPVKATHKIKGACVVTMTTGTTNVMSIGYDY